MINENALKQTLADIFEHVKILHVMISSLSVEVAAIRETLSATDPNFHEMFEGKQNVLQASTNSVAIEQLHSINEIIRKLKSGEGVTR